MAIKRSWSRARPAPQALHDRPYCFAHDPDRAAEAAEAGRLGGLRRRKEGTIAVADDLPGLDTVAGIRRVLDRVVTYGVVRGTQIERTTPSPAEAAAALFSSIRMALLGH